MRVYTDTHTVFMFCAGHLSIMASLNTDMVINITLLRMFGILLSAHCTRVTLYVSCQQYANKGTPALHVYTKLP